MANGNNGNNRIMEDKDIAHYLIDHSYEIVNSLLQNIPGDKYAFGETSVKLLRDISALSVLANATIQFEVEGKKDRVETIIKYYDFRDNNLPKGYLRAGDKPEDKPWKLTYDTYDFLKGINHVPKVFHYDAKKRIIFMEYVGSTSLEEKLEGCKTEQEKIDIFKKQIIPPLVEFQTDATEKLTEVGIIETGKTEKEININPSISRLFKERMMEERVIDYLRAIKGFGNTDDLSEGLRNMLVKTYNTIDSAYEREWCVCHGDLNTTNVIFNERGEIYFIDPKLKLRNPITDLANISACPGIDFEPDKWKELVEEFRLREIERMGAELKIKQRFRGKPKVYIQEEVIKNSYENFLKCMIHYSFRRLAKDADASRFLPIKYNQWINERKSFKDSNTQMKKNITTALDELISNRQHYTDEEADNLRTLKSLFEREIFPDLEKKTPSKIDMLDK